MATRFKPFMVHRNAGNAVFVKTREFFVAQGGDKQSWGRSWTQVWARNIEHARQLGEKRLPKLDARCVKHIANVFGRDSDQYRARVDGRRPAVSFGQLREANLKRLPHFKNNLGKRAHSKKDGSDWTILEWAGAMCGEAGEAANVAKKFRRGDYDRDNPEHVEELADEMADALIYMDILAAQVGIDLSEAVQDKWNKTSRKIGYPGRL